MAGPQARRAPYKDTLQPALHRRFSSAAAFLLAVSYLESLFLGSWESYFWAWFPIGPTGIRALAIFSCGLAILVLRIASYQVGLKTSGTGWHTLIASLLSARTYETALWYGLSSLLFSYIFQSTRSEDYNLSWITYFSGDRARLNERPVFLTCYMATYALLRTIEHYREDVDHLTLASPARRASCQKKSLGGLPDSFQTVLMELPAALVGCIWQAIAAVFVTPFLYHFFMRSFAWSWSLRLLRPFYNLPRTSMLPPSWPTDWRLLMYCASAGTGVGMIWAASNRAFSTFMVQKPLKNGHPLTDDSKDPNGSLLNGLKSKKLSIKSFAMWELALIAEGFETRRKSIYSDIDRKDGPMWSQVYAICIETLRAMESQVASYGKVEARPSEPTTTEERHRTSAPLREDMIFASHSHSSLRTGVEKALDRLVRNPGSSPASELSPIAKKTWQGAKDRVLSRESQEAVSPNQLMEQARELASSLLRVGWIGDLFSQDFQSQFAAAVLGQECAEPSLHRHAVVALCQLAIHSLTEDSYGNVHRDVPDIIRVLTSIITKVEGLRAQFPLHWTDLRGVKESPKIDAIVESMRRGLEQVLAKFEPYSTDLRLTQTDLRLAREAISKPQSVAPRARESDVKRGAVERRAEERGMQRRASRRERRPEMEQVR